MLNISEYLKTGALDGLRVGADLLLFAERMGEIRESEKQYFNPSDSTEGFSIFRQGVEYMFIDYQLYGINIDVVDSQFCLNPNFALSNHTPLSVMLAYLAIEGIDWNFYSKDTFDKIVALRLISGVKLTYQYNEDNELVLTSFYSYARMK